MTEQETDVPPVYGSLQSFASSWSRAASFSVAPLIPYDQQSLLRSSQSRHRPSFASQSTTTTAAARFPGYGPQSDPWGRRPSLITPNAHLVAPNDYGTSEEVPGDETTKPRPSIDENTALLTGGSPSISEPYIRHSTFAQTVFNTLNLLLGVGLLGMPLAFKHAGFLLGLLILTLSGITTLWTGRMIDRCLRHDNSIRSYGDLAFVAGGSKARIAVMVLVTIELTASSIGQIVLFADGAQTFINGSSAAAWKVLCGVVFIPLSCAPLHYLGITSALSVFCLSTIAGLVLVVGLTKSASPGSLHSPAHVSTFPSVWTAMPSGIGMILSAWGGHAVFPELHRDMQKPQTFFRSVESSYGISYLMYLFVGIVGYLMFGDKIQGPITSEIISLKHTPSVISFAIMGIVTFFPVSKVPLNILPLSTAAQRVYDIRSSEKETEEEEDDSRRAKILKMAMQPTIRAAIGIVFVALAILFPNLDSVMAVLGVVDGLTIAVILPSYFYLSIMKDEVPGIERFFCVFAMVVSSILAVGCLTATFMGLS